ncbi:MAG: hypothetical protein AAGE65_03900 [Planctomycetota bacterium]
MNVFGEKTKVAGFVTMLSVVVSVLGLAWFGLAAGDEPFMTEPRGDLMVMYVGWPCIFVFAGLLVLIAAGILAWHGWVWLWTVPMVAAFVAFGWFTSLMAMSVYLVDAHRFYRGKYAHIAELVDQRDELRAQRDQLRQELGLPPAEDPWE